MVTTHKDKLKELKNIIARMPIPVLCAAVLPEFGLKWSEMSRAIRNARLAMTPANVAQIMHKYVAKTLPMEQLSDIVARLRLKFVTTQNRTWHVITLADEKTTESTVETMQLLPHRIMEFLKNFGKTRLMTSEVQTTMLGDLMYVSIQLISRNKEGPILYAATPPGQPVALVSSVTSSAMVKALVDALGYARYENAKLHGRDPISLLRIHDRGNQGHADDLVSPPEYAPTPMITRNGVDFTNRQYDEEYVDRVLGADPPLLTELSVEMCRPFFNRSILNKTIALRMQLKSEDVAKTLKTWVSRGAMSPVSDFLHVFNKYKSNNIVYDKPDSD